MHGLYIYGAVGGGKTMLMDLFYAAVGFQEKRRVHFHEFMLEIHSHIHRVKKEVFARGSKSYDPIPHVAKAIMDQAWILCFDEFQVNPHLDSTWSYF